MGEGKLEKSSIRKGNTPIHITIIRVKGKDLMLLFSTGTGLERVGVAGSDPDSWLIGDAGYWIVGAGVGLLLLLIGRLWVWPSPARRTKGKEGRRGLCLWPLRCLSQILSERKREHSDCLVLAYGSAYLSLLG